PALLAEVATFYGDWAGAVPAERSRARLFRLKYLADAARYGKTLKEPRRELLAEALRQDDAPEAERQARQLVALDPKHPDAHYALADAALTASPPALAAAREHLAALDAESPRRPRTLWVEARIARAARDDDALARTLDAADAMTSGDDMDPVDAMSLLRLGVLDAQRTTDLATLEKRVETIKSDARRLTSGGEMSANRIAQVSLELEKVQRQLRAASERAEASSKSRAEGLGKSIDEVTESAFQSALKASGGAD